MSHPPQKVDFGEENENKAENAAGECSYHPKAYTTYTVGLIMENGKLI